MQRRILYFRQGTAELSVCTPMSHYGIFDMQQCIREIHHRIFDIHHGVSWMHR